MATDNLAVAASPSGEDLAEAYRNFSDEYIFDKLHSGTLTDRAVKIAGEELDSRGLCYWEASQPEASHVKPVMYHASQFVTVANSLNAMEMYILCARLEADGIPAVLADANMTQSYSLLSVAIGGTRLRVLAEHYEEAMKIIAAMNSGALAVNDDDDVGSPV